MVGADRYNANGDALGSTYVLTKPKRGWGWNAIPKRPGETRAFAFAVTGPTTGALCGCQNQAVYPADDSEAIDG